MEEILASIRRIIADDEGKARAPEPPKPAAAPAPPPRPAAPPPEPAAAAPPPAQAPSPAPASQDEIDAMLAGMDMEKSATASDEGVADVLDLTESMTAPAPQPPMFRAIEGQSDVFFAEESQEPPPPPYQEPPPRPAPVESALLSAATTHAVDAAFNTLAHTVLSQNARTLEDLVKDMMRPMLKAWLDDNLPSLVERVVRAEIERVSRGRS